MKRILTIIFILSSFVTFGQWTPQNAWGYSFKRVKTDSLVLPTDTTTKKTGIVQIGSNLFTGNGVSWAAIGGTDTSSLSNRINLRVKYTDTSSMLDAYRTAINTKVTTGSEAVLTGVKAASSAGFTIKANSGSTVATFGAGGGINANIANLSIGTAIAFNGKRLADTTDLAPFATTTSVNTALNLKADKNTTLTINGVTQDISTNRSWTVSGGPQVGTHASRIAISSPTVGQQFYQTTAPKGLFIYDGNKWSYQIDINNLLVNEHFSTGNLTYSGLTAFGGGTGNGVTLTPLGEVGYPTLAIMNTGTTTTGSIVIFPNNNNLLNNSQFNTYCKFVVRIPILSTDAESFIIRLGAPSNQGVNDWGCYFRYSHNINGGVWEAIAQINTGLTVASTGVTATTNWTVFEIAYTPLGTALYYINDILVATISTNVGFKAPNVSILKTAGTTNRQLIIDQYIWSLY